MDTMEKEIFNGFGGQVIRRKRRYFVRFDSGGSASKMIEVEITKGESKKFQISEQVAYDVLLNAQQRDEIPKRSLWSWFLWWR